MNWHRILFVVDPLGDIDALLLRKLIHLARSLNAEIDLLESAFDWSLFHQGGIGSTTSDAEVRALADRRRVELERVVAAFTESGVRARGLVRCERSRYQSILRHVQESKPDLLIMRSTRHGLLARLLLSYTDFKLIETCPCPVLLLKNEKSYLEGCVLAAVDPMHAHDKPAALDRVIVEAAQQLTTAIEGTLHLCHAYTLPMKTIDLPGEMPMPESIYSELCATHREKAEARVGELARAANLHAGRVHLSWGEPTEVIGRFAHSLNANVVVMGAVSRSSLERAFIGHTAERALDALDCDVLVVKPPGFGGPREVDVL